MFIFAAVTIQSFPSIILTSTKKKQIHYGSKKTMEIDDSLGKKWRKTFIEMQKKKAVKNIKFKKKTPKEKQENKIIGS